MDLGKLETVDAILCSRLLLFFVLAFFFIRLPQKRWLLNLDKECARGDSTPVSLYGFYTRLLCFVNSDSFGSFVKAVKYMAATRCL